MHDDRRMRSLFADERRGAPAVARLVLVAILTGAAVAGCGALAPSNALPPCEPNSPLACTVIDGYPVGRLSRDCGADGTVCGEVAWLARLALDARDPGHPAPMSVQVFDPDMARVCGPTLCALSSPASIVVFGFADDGHRATGYECAGVSPCVGTLSWRGFADAIDNPTP